MIDAGICLFFEAVGTVESDAESGRFDHFDIVGPVATKTGFDPNGPDRPMRELCLTNVEASHFGAIVAGPTHAYLCSPGAKCRAALGRRDMGRLTHYLSTCGAWIGRLGGDRRSPNMEGQYGRNLYRALARWGALAATAIMVAVAGVLRKQHIKASERGQTCIDYHQGIAHKLPEGWEEASKEQWK